MELQQALIVFDALSQETRLQAFRLLVQAGEAGMPAGELSRELGIPHNTLSFHLSHLSNAGVVNSRKEGRSVIYSANFETMNGLIAFLVKDCCRGEFATINEDQRKGRSVITLTNCCESSDSQ
jgi:ArsR family transcriptional regulator